MKKLRYGLFPMLLILSFYLGRQAQHFLGRVQHPTKLLGEVILLDDSSVEFLKTEKGSDQLAQVFQQNNTKSEEFSHEKEVKIMRRLRLLQKMTAVTNTTKPHSQWLPLLQKILQNTDESWVVQRQALKNMLPYWSQISEKQRDLILSNVDLRAKSTWYLSDKEFVQLFENSP